LMPVRIRIVALKLRWELGEHLGWDVIGNLEVLVARDLLDLRHTDTVVLPEEVEVVKCEFLDSLRLEVFKLLQSRLTVLKSVESAHD